MDTVNNKKAVLSQYATSANLNTRISIHERYSTNKLGFVNWIFSHYKLSESAKVLELGCGTGNMWQNRAEIIANMRLYHVPDIHKALSEVRRVLKTNGFFMRRLTASILQM